MIRSIISFSDKGRRPHQEDFVLTDESKRILTVADGFGGELAGAASAKAACEGVVQFLKKEAGDEDATLPFVMRSYFSLVGNVLFNALVHANRKALRLNEGRHVHEKGGASVIAGYLDGQFLALANVGACSAWLLRNGSCYELVRPKSYAQILNPGEPDPQPGTDVPMMAVGIVDDLEPEIVECRVQEGDWLVLQSDGVLASTRAQLVALQKSKGTSEVVLAELRNQTFADNASIVLAVL